MAMTKQDKARLLHGVGLFKDLGPRALRAIADLTTEIEFRPGQYIVRQGQVGTGFYVVAAGRVKVVRGGQVLAHLGPGDFFGELSLLDQSPRVAHVVAEEPTVCLGLASWDFIKLLERSPKVTLSILREVARRLRAMSDHPHH